MRDFQLWANHPEQGDDIEPYELDEDGNEIHEDSAVCCMSGYDEAKKKWCAWWIDPITKITHRTDFIFGKMMDAFEYIASQTDCRVVYI